MNHRAFLVILAIAAIGCTPSVTVTPIRSGPSLEPTPDSIPIQLFAEAKPTCQYEEIAVVTVEGQRNWVSDEKVTEELKARARKVGGHAVIGYTQTQRNVAPGGGRMAGDYRTRSGTAIRFTDPTCRR